MLKVENIGEAIKALDKVRPKRSTLPIIENVIVGPKEAYATDLESWLTVPIKTRGTGQFCLPPEFVRNLGTVTIKEEGEKTRVKHEKGYVLTPAWKLEDYPPTPPKIEAVAKFVVQSDVLEQAIADCKIAAATEESRPVLTGISFEVGKDSLTLAGADGFRLATRTISAKVVKGSGTKAIVPAKAACLLTKLGGEVTIKLSDQSGDNPVGEAEGVNAKLRLRCILGTYPNYLKLIPPEYDIKSTVDSAELASALRAVKADSGIFRIQTKGKDKLEVWGLKDETVVASTLESKNEGEGKIAFNQSYVLALTNQGKEVTIKWNTPSSPLAVQTEHGDYVIMPMFVQWEEAR